MRSVFIGFVSWLLAGSLLAVPVRVEVVHLDPTVRPSAEPVVGTLVVDVAGESMPPREVQIPGQVVVDLPVRASSRLSIKADHLWTPDRVVIPSDEGSPEDVTFEMLSAGSVQGKLAVPKGHVLPDRLDVIYQASDPENDDWKRLDPGSQVRQPCELGPEGEFSCQVPALTLDLHLHAPGFVPRYFWNVAVPARETDRLGELTLRSGASVVGRVVTAGGLPPDGAIVILEPEMPTTQHYARTESKLDRRSRRGLADRRGFFQLADIASGSYRVRIEKSGYADTESQAFTVYDGRETTLPEPLVLHPPVRFELVLEPPMDPYGRAWTVDLAPVGSHERHNNLVPETGRWTREDLAPGSYSLKIRSGTGRYEYSWWSDQIRIEPQMDPYLLDIPVLQVEGEVTLGDEPLEALVWFGGPHGGQQIRIDTNEEGLYAGYLPKEGLWRVTVVSEATGRRSLEPVEVEKPEGAQAARVNLHLPDTRIVGEVVDGEGEPVPGARVKAAHLKTLAELDNSSTDSDGEFELRGLAEGSVALSAHDPKTDRSSSLVQVHLQEEVQPQPVRLVLESHQELAGRVHWQGRAVPGTRIVALPTLPPGQGALAIVPDSYTDAQGRFSVRLPAQTIRANVTIQPPGFAAKILSVDMPRETPLEIEVSQEGGTLILVTPKRDERLPGQGATASLLQHDGAQVVADTLASWARFHGAPQSPGEATFPMMEPGSYTYCLPSPDRPPRCTSGFLPQGGELVLRIGDESVEENTTR